MNFIANHYGKKTTCEMTADGVLQVVLRKFIVARLIQNGSAALLVTRRKQYCC